MKLRVCVSLLPRSARETLTLIRRAERKSPDFIELRTDRLNNPDHFKKWCRETGVPLVATDRTNRPSRTAMLQSAAEAGFEFVDVDASRLGALSLRRRLEVNGTKAVVSTHALTSGPRDALLSDILKQHQKLRPDVSKIVTAARRASDNLVLLNFVQENSQHAQLVAFAVGKEGRLSRLLSPVFGAYFTIGSLESGRETAPGQLTVDEIRETWRMMGVT